MNNRRKLLKTIGAVLGSTALPTGVIASAITTPVVAAETAGIASAVAAYTGRHFMTQVVLDPNTFEPKIGVQSMDEDFADDKWLYVGTDAMESSIKTFDNVERIRKQYDLIAINAYIKHRGLPPLTAEEEQAIFLANEKRETV